MTADFPRGGKKLDTIKSKNSLPKNKSAKRKNSKDGTKKKNKIEEKDALAITNADRLSHSIVKEDMVIIGEIAKVTEYELKVTLPGGLNGTVLVTDLSETYTNMLNNIIKMEEGASTDFKPLPELYKPGEYVSCYVKNKVIEENKLKIQLSMEPQLVNKNIVINSIDKESKIVCSVKSKEDHGYIVDVGISTVRAFIPTKYINEGIEYFTGKQLLCAVKEITLTENAATMKLSTRPKNVAHPVVDTKILDNIVPGTRVYLKVKKILFNGLLVTFGENNIGFINQLYLDKMLSTYSIDSELIGTLLYILPIVKFSFFSLLADRVEKHELKIGEIISNAAVLFRDSSYVVFKLPHGLRGLVSMRRTEKDFSKISKKFVQGSTYKCRVLSYNPIDKVYICTMEKKLLEEKYFSNADLKLGDTVIVKVVRIYEETNFLRVKVGQIFGCVTPDNLPDTGLKKLKVGDKINARVCKFDEQGRVNFTLKQALISSKLPILTNIFEAEIDAVHHGVVVKITKGGVLVKFFDNARGFIPRTSLSKETAKTNWNYSVGQVISVKIENVNKEENKIILSPHVAKKATVSEQLSISEEVSGTIVEASTDGVYVRIDNKNTELETAFLPAGHMAPSKEISSLLAAKSAPGDKIKAFVFATTPTLILTKTFLPSKDCQKFDDLKVGDYILCSVRDIEPTGVRVVLPIENYTTFGFVPFKAVSHFDSLYSYQVLFAKITSINKKDQQLGLTLELEKIWSDENDHMKKILTAVDVLGLHLKTISKLAEKPYYKSRPISSLKLGQRVEGTVEKVTEYGLILKLENDVKAIVQKDHYLENFKVGDKVTGCVLWLNYVDELANVTLIKQLINSINPNQGKIDNLPTDTPIRGVIVMVTSWFILVVLKGKAKGCLAVVPPRLHANDICPNLTPYKVNTFLRCYTVLNKNESSIVPICVIKAALEEQKLSKKEKKQLKRQVVEELNKMEKVKKIKLELSNKIVNNEKPKVQKKKLDIHEEESTNNKRFKREESIEKSDEEDTSDEEEGPLNVGIVESKKDEDSKIKECGFFFNDNSKQDVVSDVTSNNNEECQEEQEEARTRNELPKTTDEFDKLVLSSPNSSQIWLEYMSFHLVQGEIVNARAILQRAIKTINISQKSERLNVFNAWLRMEFQYGNEETLQNVFHEALRSSDEKEIFEKMIELHADKKHQQQLEKTVNKALSKFKEEPDMWVMCGKAYLQAGLKEKSRQIMERALNSLNISHHIDVMHRFAKVENEIGDKYHSQSLFEKILSAYPKRADIWCAYVDMLVKSGNVDLARNVLERAVIQNIPPKKVKKLYKKFVSFEKQNGTPESIKNVQKMFNDYIEKQFG